MLKIVIKNLIRRLNAHNTCCVTGAVDHYNEAEINLLLDMLQEFNVKVAVAAINPNTQKTMGYTIEHASHRLVSSWGGWKYAKIHFDFSKMTKNELEFNYLTNPLNKLNLKWPSATTAICELD